MSEPTPALPIHSGHASEQGVRPTMEDEVLIKESFSIPNRGHFSFFGVFDGHGGRAAAIFTRDHLFELLLNELRAGSEPTQALTQAYLGVDKAFIQHIKGQDEQHQQQHETREDSVLTVKVPSPHAANSTGSHKPDPITKNQSKSIATSLASTPNNSPPLPQEKDTSGTTAVSILLHHDTYTLYVANVGDSRAVLSGANGRVVSLTNDHKADRPDEVDRIRRAGGFVIHKRVMGELAISRAIGDLDFKETGFLFVLADPELCTYQLHAGDEFILLACDGIYDVMSNEQSCTFIRDSLKAGKSLDETSSALVHHSIDTLNTRDNVTVIIVKLPTEQELQQANIKIPESNGSVVSPTKPQLKDSHVQTPVPPPSASPAAPTSSSPTTPINSFASLPHTAPIPIHASNFNSHMASSNEDDIGSEKMNGSENTNGVKMDQPRTNLTESQRAE